MHVVRHLRRGEDEVQVAVAVKLVAEYVEQAVRFNRMAAEAIDPKLKESLEH